MKINRRSFVEGGAAAGVVLSMVPTVLSGQDDRRVRLGMIGVGGRGTDLLKTALKIPQVDVPAVCDLVPRNIANCQNLVQEARHAKPEGYGPDERAYLQLLQREDLDGVIIATPWELHIPMAVAAMKANKYSAIEVGPASSVEECWELVNTYEQTRFPCMLLENYCYFSYNMAILQMVRQGIFGEIVHCQCGYGHDLRERIVMGKGTGPTPKGVGDYRSTHNQFRNGDLYPTHGIGPIAQCLNIQRGNRFAYLTSTATKTRGLAHWSRNNLPPGHDRRDIDWRQGDIVTTTLKCQNEETIIVNFDTRLPRPMSFMYWIQGTQGMWMQDGDTSSPDKSTIYLDGVSPHHRWESFDAYQKKFEHPVWKKHLGTSESQGGHGGSDFLEVRDFVDCILAQAPVPIDVYDAAAWMAISPLSEASVAKGSAPVEFPDFTEGKWMTNKPIFGFES